LLGPLQGKSVLDIGCGSGWVTLFLAAAGADVVAFDVSIEACRLTAATLRANRYRASTAMMHAHAIALRAGTFDLAFALGVLHHMNLARVAQEIHDLLKPGGRFVFYEPLAYGPVMWALRPVQSVFEWDPTGHA
jgi:SAM-dependent methyltransferase